MRTSRCRQLGTSNETESEAGPKESEGLQRRWSRGGLKLRYQWNYEWFGAKTEERALCLLVTTAALALSVLIDAASKTITFVVTVIIHLPVTVVLNLALDNNCRQHTRRAKAAQPKPDFGLYDTTWRKCHVHIVLQTIPAGIEPAFQTGAVLQATSSSALTNTLVDTAKQLYRC